MWVVTFCKCFLCFLIIISIHTTRVGGDSLSSSMIYCFIFISIHTTRVGGDEVKQRRIQPIQNFNPHHPCGWWQYTVNNKTDTAEFQSTPPVWVVTRVINNHRIYKIFQSTPPVWVVTTKGITLANTITISIHTTRVGGDVMMTKISTKNIQFQSTPPVWVVTLLATYFSLVESISIHTTRVGGDLFCVCSDLILPPISIHTTRVGGDISNNADNRA